MSDAQNRVYSKWIFLGWFSGARSLTVGYKGQFPRIDMHPRLGVYATSALLDAGARPDETVSSPMPNAAKEAAVATAEPLDEPDAKAAAR